MDDRYDEGRYDPADFAPDPEPELLGRCLTCGTGRLWREPYDGQLECTGPGCPLNPYADGARGDDLEHDAAGLVVLGVPDVPGLLAGVDTRPGRYRVLATAGGPAVVLPPGWTVEEPF